VCAFVGLYLGRFVGRLFVLKMLVLHATGGPDGKVSVMMTHLQRLLSSAAIYFYPTNTGDWSHRLGTFVHCLCAGVGERIAKAAVQNDEGQNPGPGHEVFMPSTADRYATVVCSKFEQALEVFFNYYPLQARAGEAAGAVDHAELVFER
jgi:hypothetical protein